MVGGVIKYWVMLIACVLEIEGPDAYSDLTERCGLVVILDTKIFYHGYAGNRHHPT